MSRPGLKQIGQRVGECEGYSSEKLLTPNSVRKRRFEARRQTWMLDLLFLRESPLKRRSSSIDAVSMPTRLRPRSAIRARAENCLLLARGPRKINVCTCELTVMC